MKFKLWIGIHLAGLVMYAQTPSLSGGKMLDCSGLPCADVTLANGNHLRLLIDTGDVSSIVDSAAAQKAGLPLTPALSKDGKAMAGFNRAVMGGVKLGDAALGDVKVLVTDLSADVKANRLPAVDGTLAYTAFTNRLLELDYKGRMVRVSGVVTAETSFACSGLCGDLSTPTFGKQGPPIVVTTGFFVNGHSITAQIDTLFSGTTLVYPGAIAKLGLAQTAKTDKQRFFPYTDGGVQMLEAEADTEGFGKTVIKRNAPIYFATASVHLPDDMFDATVGAELFKNAVLQFDFHNMKFSLKE